MSIALFALAGILVGGAWSLYKQGSSRVAVGVAAVIAALAVVGGVAWLLPGEG